MHVEVAKDSFNWTSCNLAGKRKSWWTRVVFCRRETKASEMTESERAVIPQQKGPPSIFFIQERRGEDGGEKGVEKGAGWITEEPRASVSCLFIYSPCLFFFSSSPAQPPSLFLPPIFNTLSLCPLSAPPPTASISSLFSSLYLPREKRFCLLLVSAPSQSAFLISSYCFCLIFKCYPRPNGNPYKKKWGERERERGGKRNRLGIVFHSRTLRQSPPTPPQGKIWKVLGGVEGWGESGLEDGSQVQSKGGDIFLWCLLAPCTTL